MISKALDQHGVASILHHLNNGVIERVLVLLQPSSQVVGDSGGIVNNTKVSIGVTHLGVGLAEVGAFAHQVVKQLTFESIVSGLGEKRLFLKDGQQAHGLLKHVNARLQIHAKVNISPVQTFLDIFLLLKGEHVLVEELLELLIDIVDTDLLESVELKDLETSNIQDTNIVDLLHARVNQSFITLLNNKSEGSLIDSTSNTTNRVGSSSTGGALGDPLSSNLQLGLAEVGDHPLGVNTSQSSNLLGIGIILDLSLLFLSNWDKVLGHVTHVHHDSSVLVDIVLLFLGESKRLEGFMSILHVFLVINGGDSQFTLGDIPVVKDVVGQETLFLDVRNLVRHDVVEGEVASLKRLLVSKTRLLQQVDNHVSTGQLTRGVEMDTDEFTKTGRVIISDSLGITPGLQDRVGGNNLVLKRSLSLLPLARGADGGKVGDDLLGVLSLSSTRLSSNQDGLVVTSVHHALVGSLSNGKDVGPAFISSLANIQLHSTESVDGESLVRIDSNTEETRVGVDKLVDVSDNRVPQDTGITKICEVSHVIGAVIVGGIDLANLGLLENLDFSSNIDLDFATLSGLHQTLKVASISLVGDPDGLLGVIRLSLELLLELKLDLQPGGWIRVGS